MLASHDSGLAVRGVSLRRPARLTPPSSFVSHVNTVTRRPSSLNGRNGLGSLRVPRTGRAQPDPKPRTARARAPLTVPGCVSGIPPSPVRPRAGHARHALDAAPEAGDDRVPVAPSTGPSRPTRPHPRARSCNDAGWRDASGLDAVTGASRGRVSGRLEARADDDLPQPDAPGAGGEQQLLVRRSPCRPCGSWSGPARRTSRGGPGRARRRS